MRPTCRTDEEILACVLAHDAEAWREFHHRFDRLIFRTIDTVLRPFRAQLGSDSTAEVHASFLLALHERDMLKLRAFDAQRGPSLAFWLRRLASNCATDFMRTQLRRRAIVLPDDGIERASGAPDAFREVSARQRLLRLSVAVAELSERDRELWVLSIEHGGATDKIAAQMRVSVKTIYSKTHKMRAKLRRAIESKRPAPYPWPLA